MAATLEAAGELDLFAVAATDWTIWDHSGGWSLLVAVQHPTDPEGYSFALLESDSGDAREVVRALTAVRFADLPARLRLAGLAELADSIASAMGEHVLRSSHGRGVRCPVCQVARTASSEQRFAGA